ncbi:hypothetical protein BaRGS_00008298 [Batillaria attramentaria]|uniref:Uncharacterized protein n=1 Tax=Batillaria attramentaria TaxID=370345 RepID=A0ABD0LMB2_9CAEN
MLVSTDPLHTRASTSPRVASRNPSGPVSLEHSRSVGPALGDYEQRFACHSTGPEGLAVSQLVLTRVSRRFPPAGGSPTKQAAVTCSLRAGNFPLALSAATGFSKRHARADYREACFMSVSGVKAEAML